MLDLLNYGISKKDGLNNNALLSTALMRMFADTLYSFIGIGIGIQKMLDANCMRVVIKCHFTPTDTQTPTN